MRRPLSPAQTYDRVDRLFTRLAGLLDAGIPGVMAKWFANQLAQAAVPEQFRCSTSVAADGTDVETWGALHGEVTTVTLDGEAADTQLIDGGVAKPYKAARKAQSGGGRSGWPERLHRRRGRPSRAPLRNEQS